MSTPDLMPSPNSPAAAEAMVAAEAVATADVAVAVTNAAAGRLRQLMHDNGISSAALRVYVSGGGCGCSGLQYGMGFVTQAEPDDAVFESSGLSVVVDPVSISYLQGATVDFVDNERGGSFKIDNPNADSGCGCSSEGEGAADGGCGCGGGCSCG